MHPRAEQLQIGAWWSSVSITSTAIHRSCRSALTCRHQLHSARKLAISTSWLPPMASRPSTGASLAVAVSCAVLLYSTSMAGFVSAARRLTQADDGWLSSRATYYGAPDGDGTDAGNCGYGTLTGTPFGSNIAAGSPALYQDGLGCGACFQVKCNYDGCASSPTQVVITDQCPGGEWCGGGQTHFDLSGTAFGNLAVAGRSSDLFTRGVLDIQYKRVPCSYDVGVTFALDANCNPNWLAFVVKYQGGDGDLETVEIKDSSSAWQQMKHGWGASWQFDGAGSLHGALSVRLTSKTGGQVLVAEGAIPSSWTPGQAYSSQV